VKPLAVSIYLQAHESKKDYNPIKMPCPTRKKNKLSANYDLVLNFCSLVVLIMNKVMPVVTNRAKLKMYPENSPV
jgi:hypothetical protein